MKCIVFTLFLAGYGTTGSCSEFLNLNFEAANTNNVVVVQTHPTIQMGPINELLPNWQVYSGTNLSRSTLLSLNSFAASPGYATLATRNGGNEFFNAGPFPIEGNFALFLSPSFMVFPGQDYIPLSIAQMGTVPLDALSLSFLSFGGPWQFQINGVTVPLSYDCSCIPNSDYFIATALADVSPFAGMDVELRFSTLVPGRYVNGIDNIQFIPVPEPATWALWGLGGLLIASRLRKRSS